MSIEKAVYNRLSNYAGLTSLVGTRIYPIHLPQDTTYPAVTYQRVSSERESAMSADTGDVHVRVQVTAWSRSTSPLEAMNVTDQIRAALKRDSGTYNSVQVKSSFMVNENAFYDYETKTHYVTSDFDMVYVET